MMSQYDAEQLQLENRIAELREYSNAEPGKADHARFVALLKKYRNPEVLMDEILRCFLTYSSCSLWCGRQTCTILLLEESFFNL